MPVNEKEKNFSAKIFRVCSSAKFGEKINEGTQRVCRLANKCCKADQKTEVVRHERNILLYLEGIFDERRRRKIKRNDN